MDSSRFFGGVTTARANATVSAAAATDARAATPTTPIATPAAMRPATAVCWWMVAMGGS